MKTFKQFMETFIKANATPKGTFTYPYDTRDGGILDKIRTKDAIDYENAEFLRNTQIPIDLTKKKKMQKIKVAWFSFHWFSHSLQIIFL